MNSSSLFLFRLCSPAVVPYVDAVVAVMRVLLFAYDVRVDGNAGVRMDAVW